MTGTAAPPGTGTAGTGGAILDVRDLPAARLKAALGISAVSHVENPGSLAVVDSTLE